MSIRIAETQVLNAVLDLLQALRVVAFRMNTGMMRAEHKGKIRIIRFGVPGMADLLAIPTVRGKFKGLDVCWCEPWFLECKSASGRQSAAQRSFQKQVTGAGAQYFIIRSADELEDHLRRHGVIR